ncbi:MAG: hypothetical protein ACXVGC_13625 [Mycobacteriaceae bacterium]
MNGKQAVLGGVAAVGVVAAAVGAAYAVHPFHHEVDASWAQAYPTLDEMTQHADAVVSGHVIGEQGTETSASDASLIYTDFTFHVDTWVAGKPDGDVVLLHQVGGASGFNSSEVQDDPAFKIGEQDVLFLKMYAPGKYFVMGGPTGRMPVSVANTVTSMPASVLKVTGAPSRSAFIGQVKRIAVAQGKAS